MPEFRIRQSLVGMQLHEVDTPVLRYLSFFKSRIPVESAYLLHVVPSFADMVPFPEEITPPIVREQDWSTQLVERMVGEVEQELDQRDGIYLEYEIQEGNALEMLLLQARTMKADLLVLGQAGSTDAHEVLAANLIRQLDCDTLVVPQYAKPMLERIMVPVDFSENSARALRKALAMNRQMTHTATIHCVHLYELPEFNAYRISKTPEQLKTQFFEDRVQAMQRFLNEVVPANQRSEVKSQLIHKDLPGTASYLLEFARVEEINLILIGAKGHSQVERLLLGSVTEELLRINEEVAVWVVK